MDYTNFIGTTAAILTTAANVPQTYKIIKEKNTVGISAYTYSMLLVGTLLWVTYGILNTDLPVILANGVTAITCIIILILNFTSPKVIEIIHETVLPEEIKKEVRAAEQNASNE